MGISRRNRVLFLRAAGVVVLASSTLAGGIGPVSCSQNLPQQLSGPRVGIADHHSASLR